MELNSNQNITAPGKLKWPIDKDDYILEDTIGI